MILGRHSVIENTIVIEEALNKIIIMNMNCPQQKFIENLDRQTFYNKIIIVENIIMAIKKELPKDFIQNFDRFRKIRNDFAHSLSPKKIKQPTMIAININSEKKSRKEIIDWKSKIKEHYNLFLKLSEELKPFYQ